MSNQFLTIEDFLGAASKLPTQIVEIPELGGKVELQALTDLEVDLLAASLRDEVRTGAMRRAWIVACSRNPKLTYEHVDALANMGSSITLRLWNAVRDLNGLNDDAEEAAQKNS